ncbi:MAG: zinc-dependent metalloprotease [Acidobacteria bacterium]|nr:zinc-dependent metalloprotease [Acidobacteriota bacterium]
MKRSLFRFGLSIPLLAAVLVIAAATPVAARKSKKPKESAGAGKEESKKSLEETVEGTEKIAGLMNFYRSPEKLYLHVPEELIGAPLGLAAVLVNAVGDWSVRGSGLETSVVNWEAVGNRLILLKKNLDFRADPDSSIHSAVEATFPDSPVFSAQRIQLRDEPAPFLIDAKSLFGPQLVEILPSQSGYYTKPEDATLAYVKAFPDNVVARVIYRFHRRDRSDSPNRQSTGSPFARFLGPGRLADPRTVQVTVDYYLFRLPADGYRPRFADQRVGGWSIPYKDYTDVDRRDSAFRHILIRWDLRKQDPEAEMSPPIEPVTFYIDRSVPEEWRSLVRDATLWWNTAFEKVGFRDAIRVLDQPDDPDWDPADIHHTMIYWNLSDNLIFSGLAGPAFFDPRTGKVVKANVYLNGEFPSYALHRYLVYAWWRAPDPGLGQAALPFPSAQDLRDLRSRPFFCDRAASFSSQLAFARLVLQSRGVLRPGTVEATRFAQEAFAELVSHEVGHALGFPHNWKASLVSDHEAVASGKVNGRAGPSIFSSSVMDYNPIYLAPRGMEQGDYFLREVGPYDDLTVEYIYRPLDGMSAEEELRALDIIAARAETENGMIYDSGVLNAIDPTASADDLGDDPLEFAESRLRMLRGEVLPHFKDLVLAEGHDYNLLRQALDSAIFSVAMDYIDLTARHIGGQYLLRRVAGSAAAPQGGPAPITPVEPATQRRALDILENQLFAEGAFTLPPEVLEALKADLQFDWNYPWRFASDYSVGTRIAGLYNAALSTLFEPGRLGRVLDNERRYRTKDRFTIPELFGRLEAIAFRKLPTAGKRTVTDSDPLISPDRRALQRLLVSHLARLALTPAAGTPAEASQVAAFTLRSIERRIAGVGEGAVLDRYTRAHLEDLTGRIRRTLEAVTQVPAGI